MLAALALAATAGCAGDFDTTETDDQTEAVVGGRRETGYAAAGYLMARRPGGRFAGPWCGATLIGPDVAVTAAHCIVAVRREWGTRVEFAVGFGAVYSGPAYPARRVWRSPGYNPALDAPVRYLHDVAVMRLQAPVPGIEPATIAPVRAGCTSRSIGYGRVTPGGYGVQAGYTSERKSTAQCYQRQTRWSIFAQGAGGGLCWGDSGGALMVAGTNRIAGVLADFNGRFRCSVGNAMIFTSLWGERRYIARVLASDPTAPAPPAPAEDPALAPDFEDEPSPPSSPVPVVPPADGEGESRDGTQLIEVPFDEALDGTDD